MRMWMVDPKIMCRQHLLGEHLELHMFIGHMKKKRKIDGYIKNNCLHPRMIFQRHEDLVKEMKSRRYNHKSILTEEDCGCIYNYPIEYQYWEINKAESLTNLLNRCNICKARFEQLKNIEQIKR